MKDKKGTKIFEQLEFFWNDGDEDKDFMIQLSSGTPEICNSPHLAIWTEYDKDNDAWGSPDLILLKDENSLFLLVDLIKLFDYKLNQSDWFREKK